jgi:hypothetical protein
VWLLLIGPPSDGKTEVIVSTTRLLDVHCAATLSEAALLSGVAKRDREQGATGGLLRQIGDSGIIVSKDFGSILNLRPDDRASVLAALREIYDGAWARPVGTGGGKVLRWEGKCGFIGGATPTIDRHHGVMGTMGERFALFRLPPGKDQDEDAKALDALSNSEHEETMRAELARAVCGLFATELHEPRGRSEDEDRWLVGLARLTVRARSAVERDRFTREIELPPTAEGPARLVKMLARLLSGLDAIGLERDDARALIAKIALDTLPALRRRILEHLRTCEESPTTSEVAEALNLPTKTTARGLEDLNAHRLIDCERGGQGKANRWAMREWTRERLAGATYPAKSPKPGSAREQPLINYPLPVLGGFAGRVAPEGQQTRILEPNLAPESKPSRGSRDGTFADEAVRRYGGER